jgi:hypothetical protein
MTVDSYQNVILGLAQGKSSSMLRSEGRSGQDEVSVTVAKQYFDAAY